MATKQKDQSEAHTSPDVEQLLAPQRLEICRVGRSLFERGYVHGTAGNISVRLPENLGFLITPTDACLGYLSAKDLAWVAPDGEHLAGQKPSKTLALHRRIYEEAPAANCVIHTHSTHLVALSLQGVWQPDAIVPPITPYYVMKVGKVPLIPYLRPGDPKMGEAVAEALQSAQRRGTVLRAVMMDKLGPNVWHESPSAAMATLEELEETARLWLTATKAHPLNEAQLHELQQHFGAVW